MKKSNQYKEIKTSAYPHCIPVLVSPQVYLGLIKEKHRRRRRKEPSAMTRIMREHLASYNGKPVADDHSNTEKRRRLSIYLDEDGLNQLQQLSERLSIQESRCVSLSEVLRRAMCARYLP